MTQATQHLTHCPSHPTCPTSFSTNSQAKQNSILQNTCQELHMERCDESAAAYEQVIAQHGGWYRDRDEGLKAARRHQQPDWATIP